jgi:hypothetical protein
MQMTAVYDLLLASPIVEDHCICSRFMKLSRLIGFALVMPTDASCPETNVDEVNV